MSTYTGDYTRTISFPLGGIGSGSIGLAGNGRLRDWEIFNRPFKNSTNAFTHIMVRAEDEHGVIDARVLQGDDFGDATGGETVNIHRGNGGYGYGFGPYRGTMMGVPHFERCDFTGEYPFAHIRFSDDAFPGCASLSAFNPFIPMNDKDSSLPASFFEVTFQNTTDRSLSYTALFTLNNPLPFGTTVNRAELKKPGTFIDMCTDVLPEDSPINGTLCLASDARNASVQEYWRRAEWFDALQTFWQDVHEGGPLKNRRYEAPQGGKLPYKLDGEEHATLAAHLYLSPGETGKARFVVAWHFPNCVNYWNPEKDKQQTVWKNYYATLFPDAHAVAAYALEAWERLEHDTLLFKDALFSTTLPRPCIEAASANLSILKSSTCLRLENGEFYGFEGCATSEGCCEGNCSHVWNYAYALPYLFPGLERSMRDLEYRYSMREDGAVSFRLMLPLGRPRYEFRPCVDGQMGGVIKTYRDYRISGDLDWLKRIWPSVKKSIEFAWADTNEDLWDHDQDGVMEGRQHHTLDMELFGPSAWLNGYYLAALKAGAEMAKLVGEPDTAERYLLLFENGRAWCDKHLFNGRYYEQKVDLSDMQLLLRYDNGKPLVGNSSVDAYWDDEKAQIKYQVANGSSIDQVSAQWHANLCGLGRIFDEEQVRTALASVFRYNFKPSARNQFNAARIYCMNGEGGTRVCAWPEDAKKPVIPITYSEEVFCGMEYAVAAHMIQEGLLDEGYRIVEAVRKRFDGKVRNPWNEFECGSNYARSMASFSLIPAASGFTCDLGKGEIGFDPKPKGFFRSFFSVDGAWGIFTRDSAELRVEVLYGKLNLRRLGLPGDFEAAEAELNGCPVQFEQQAHTLVFDRAMPIGSGHILRVCAEGVDNGLF